MYQRPLIPLPESGDPDPSNLPGWLYWVDCCGSTNDWAIAHAQTLPPGSVIFTRRQTAGRGQHGRLWHAPTGVLTASFVLEIPTDQLSGLSLALGLAVIHAIEDLLPDRHGECRLKWPNDVFIEGRKVAGILCESTSRGKSKNARIVAGIGLNRCVDFAQAGLSAEQVGNAISLHQISALVPEELALLERLRHHLMQVEEVFSSAKNAMSGLTAFLPELRDRDLLLHRPLQLLAEGELHTGQGAGIDAMGRLLLKRPTGEVEAFASGRVCISQEGH